jgi:uncharacterized LabA/DUF88 family protein
MQFIQQERTALFIDGANLYAATRSLGFDIDYRRLLSFFSAKTNLVRAYYYSALLETEEYSPLKPLTDWLAYNGFMLELAPRLDHAVLFSGDSDFRRLVEAVQRRGVRVSVISSIKTNPPMIADELRRQADHYIELADIAPGFTRKATEGRARGAERDYDEE